MNEAMHLVVQLRDKSLLFFKDGTRPSFIFFLF